MSAESQRTCSNCGLEFSGTMEFCPVCMLRRALPGVAESGESSIEQPVKTTLEQPVQRYEHYSLMTGDDGKPIELGRGAMGVTYKAIDINLRCPVTLKVISERYLGEESARLRFVREARTAASVRHQNVASVFHLGKTGSSYFYAMEFVDGETLQELIKRSGRLDVKLALEIATQVAAGLAAIHKQNLVHRDIKPTNIMVRPKEGDTVTAKIIDLGLAKTLDESASEAGISSPGAFAGTPEFASPEQFTGIGVDIRSDLYSLGVVLWEMLTGQVVFKGSPAEVMYRHQHAPLQLERLKDVPQPVVVLLEKLLEKDPERRFQNPNELLKVMPTIMGAIDAWRRMPQSIELEHYQLLQNEDGSLVELGRGTMGITYKAFDRNLRCDVALKVISGRLLEDETAASRFLREARNAAKLRHRNVASVFHLGRHGGSFFYAMEFIDGETLTARVNREGQLDCLFALEITQQVAAALIAAEAQRLVHRDIKPSNLMLVRESDGEILVKLIDFGLAKTVMMQSTADLTSGGFVGTPYFASPEQLDRQAEDIRSDIYSLGVTLWFMLTGKPTFMGSVASVIAQHMDRTPPFDELAILPAEVVAVLRRMLEKDRARRIQTPTALRSELRFCIELLRSRDPKPNLSEFGEGNFETITLSTSPTTSLLPQVGALVKERYRLIEDLDPANPGRSYHSEDISTSTRVGLRLFRVPDDIFTQIEEEAKRVQAVAHPNILEVHTVGRERTFSFAVFEWLDGFSLSDLLRARRSLTPREICLLLKQIAPTLDQTQASGLHLELNLHDIIVHFPEGFGQPSADLVLRCPLDEWPPFVVKLDALGKAHEPGDTATGDDIASEFGLASKARSTDRQESAQVSRVEQEVLQLGLLVYQLLGGKPGGFTPLATASEDENRILRRCLTPGQSFFSATEFYRALGAISDIRPAMAGNAVNVVAQRTGPNLETRQSGIDSSVGTPPVAPRRGGRTNAGNADIAAKAGNAKKGVVLWLALIVIGAGAAGFGWWLVNRTYTPGTTTAVIAKASPTAKKVISNLPSLETGKPWTNTLQMKFAPIGDIHFAVWQTRVRDFEAFVQATGYDAVGGMSSVVTRNGFKLNSLSWKDPGFAQTPEHPVVGVSWEDAGQFCNWLSHKEQSEGILSAFQRYRLPTDVEWSQAIGLPHETGATPAERSGGIKNVYPWGSRFPPPNDFGNYAGTESTTGAPGGWSIIAGYHDAFARTGPVTAFRANRYGLCSLGGNVWEWCEDKYQNGLNWRTLRGGSWATSRNEETLSSYRRGYDPYFRSDDVGFRCVIASDGGRE